MTTIGKRSLQYTTAILLLFTLFYGKSSQAQFSNTEYDFEIKSLDDETQDSEFDTITNFTLDCLAANGYGQWTTTSNSIGPDPHANANRNPAGWYLLGNNLLHPHVDDLSSATDKNVAPAISAFGTFGTTSGNQSTYPFMTPLPTRTRSRVKATANLDGRVRFVWLNPAQFSIQSTNTTFQPNTVFIVYGLNDKSDASFSGIDNQIDISLADYNVTIADPSSGPSLHKWNNNRTVVKQTIANYSPFRQSPANRVVTTGSTIASSEIPNGDWRDVFDVAIDKNFLYIVWHANNSSTGADEIWITASSLTDGAVVAGFPKQIVDQNNAGVPGIRPTVACDVRNNPSSPTCDIVFIQVSTTPTSNNILRHCAVTNGTLTLNTNLFSTTNRPGIPTTSTYYVSHARIVVSSEPNTGARRKAIYMIATFSSSSSIVAGNRLLLQEVPLTGAVPNAEYIEGPEFAGTRTTPLPSNTGLDVLDRHVRSLTNPYDALITNPYDQFHCLYQVIIPAHTDPENPTGPQIPVQKPIVMVNGFNNGVNTKYNAIGTSSDTRLALTTYNVTNASYTNLSNFTDPDDDNAFTKNHEDMYVAAVNQMGIHVHWLSQYPISPTQLGNATHYYARDLNRTFNEDIEENTLVTAACKINGNGSTLLDGRRMTLFTNIAYGRFNLEPSPKWTASYFNRSDYFPPDIIGIGQLTLDANFKVGSLNNQNNPAIVANVPYAKYIYNGDYEIRFYPGSIFDFYQETDSHEQAGDDRPDVFVGATGSQLILQGTSTNPVLLKIHGGSEFQIPNKLGFLAYHTNIDLKYEPPTLYIYQFIPSSGYFDNHTGRIRGRGAISITYSSITSHISSGQEDIVQVIQPNGSASELPRQAAIGNTDITNDGAGTAVLRYKTKSVATPAFGSSSLYDGTYTRTHIAAENPANTFSISNIDFVDARGVAVNNNNIETGAIDFTKNLSGEYDVIQISDCTFDKVTAVGTTSFNADAIHFKDFAPNSSTTTLDNIIIDNNVFAATTAQTQNELHAAIHLQNTKAKVRGNSITGIKYANGIVNKGLGLSPLLTNTLFCSNIISLSDGTTKTGNGINTDNWSGYSKMNDVSQCDIGHLSSTSDKGFIILSHYYENQGVGLRLDASSCAIRMNGAHGSQSGGTDMAAFDTIDNNNAGNSTGQVSMAEDAKLFLGPEASWWTNVAGNSVESGTSGSTKLITGDGSSTSSIEPNSGPVGPHYWGGHTPQVNNPTSGVFDSKFPNVTYTGMPAPPSSRLGRNFSVVCNWTGEPPGGGALTPQETGTEFSTTLVNEDGTYSDSICTERLGLVNGLMFDNRYKEAYDTGKSYIEHCYYLHGSWEGFTSATAAAGSMSNDNGRWVEYREWLKSVLYLNTVDPQYYCQDVKSILTTFQYNDPKRGVDINGAAAVARYIMESNKCPSLNKYLGQAYSESRQSQYQKWQDTVTVDTNLYKLDTTLPSLEEIDLEILRGLNGVASKPYTLNGSALASLRSSNNPFTNETTLELEVSKLAYIRFEVFNELGQIVLGEGSGKVYEPGKHRFVLNGSSLNSGVYYARFSTLRDEVKTIKLRHVK